MKTLHKGKPNELRITTIGKRIEVKSLEYIEPINNKSIIMICSAVIGAIITYICML